MRRALGAIALLLVLAPAARADASRTTCDADIASRPGTPVLLVHGTGVDARTNWSWGYAPALRDRGHGICTVDLPEFATIDIQDTIGITRDAVRETYAKGSGRKIAIIGHSQGAFQGVAVLRRFPRLAPMVDDVVGLAGLYQRGSDALLEQCAKDPCGAALWQVRTGAHYVDAMARLPFPAGPTVTAVGTMADTVVTPQPAVNALPAGAGRSVELQDICPGRQAVHGYDHIFLAADAVGYALAVDALDHPGPADPARIDPAVCLEEVFPGVDPIALAAITPDLAKAAQGAGTPVAGEPPLRCPLAAGCGRRDSARFVHRRVARGAPVVVRVHAVAGAVLARVRATRGTRTVVTRAVRVPRGRSTIRLSLPAGRWRAVVELRRPGASGFAPASRTVTLGVLR